MTDYAEWLRRTERFVRRTSSLAGNWSMEIAIDPPLDPAAADRLAEKLPHGIPQSLRSFYVTASANAVCAYSWTPSARELERIQNVLPDQHGISGGTSLCPATDLAEHHEQLIGWGEMFRDSGGYGPAAAQTLADCVPLISVGNGDYVAIHVKAAPGSAGIVYVSHETDASETSPIIPLAHDMDQFMQASERIGYLGPEIWVLDAFLENSPTGLLDTECPLARQWQKLMASLGFPVTL
jgi:hypothetical protein